MGDSFYEAIGNQPIPKFVKVRQHFEDNRIEDVEKKVREEVLKEEIISTIKPGMSICLTAGSRPIDKLNLILKTIASIVKERGAHPFIIPAMGSHGGGTAEGQTRIINSYGVTEEYCGCPIRATMDTVPIGYTEEGQVVQIDKYAYEADGIIVVGKIRPHTGFQGKYESGLMKMMTIGLGKQHGASVCHYHGAKYLAHNIPMFAHVILKNCKIMFGFGIVENAYHKTYLLEAVPAAKIPDREPELLQIAYKHIPRLMFKNIDAMVIDEIGKNISGDGMDPYVTTRFATPYVKCDEHVQKVGILDLSKETHGGMLGAGYADVCTKRMFDKCNLEDSYVNAITSTIYDCVRIPMIVKNDYYVFAACIRGCVEIDRSKARMVYIHNTLSVYDFYISESMLEDAKNNTSIEILSEPQYLKFNEQGNLW